MSWEKLQLQAALEAMPVVESGLVHFWWPLDQIAVLQTCLERQVCTEGKAYSLGTREVAFEAPEALARLCKGRA